jgi:MFS family permease
MLLTSMCTEYSGWTPPLEVPLSHHAGMIGCALSANFAQLLAARCLTGVGSALQNTGAQLFLADISTTENRAQCLGTNQVACCSTPGTIAVVRLKAASVGMLAVSLWKKQRLCPVHALRKLRFMHDQG